MTGILRIKDADGVWHDIQAIKGADGERGPVGPVGPKGADGTVKFEDLTEEQRESLRGPIGETGPQGPIGETGPAGKNGENGKDYVLTEEDKAEIAGMIPGADVDLSDYYTKTEIDDLLANLPAGDIPSGEEVEF